MPQMAITICSIMARSISEQGGQKRKLPVSPQPDFRGSAGVRRASPSRSRGRNLQSWGALHCGADESRSRFSIEAVSVGAQSSQAAGSPCNQRECAGFNWPPPSIRAAEPVSSSPEAVKRAGPICLVCAVNVSATPRLCLMPALSASSALGVAQPASATVLRHESVFPASL